MIEVYLKPATRMAWQYDGTNWDVIESEAIANGLTVDGTESGGVVTITVEVFGVDTELVANATDWIIQNGSTVGVLTDAEFETTYLPVET